MRLKLGDGFYFVDGYLRPYGDFRAPEVGCEGALIIEDRDDNRSAFEVTMEYLLPDYVVQLSYPFVGWNKANPDETRVSGVVRGPYGREDAPDDPTNLEQRSSPRPPGLRYRDTADPDYQRRFDKQFHDDVVWLLMDSGIGISRQASGMFACYILGGFYDLREQWILRLSEPPPPWEQWKKAHPLKTAIDFVREFYEGGAQSMLRKMDPKGYKAFHGRCRYEGIDPGSILAKGVFDPDAVLEKYGGTLPSEEELAKRFKVRSLEYMEVERAKRALAKRLARQHGKARRVLRAT